MKLKLNKLNWILSFFLVATLLLPIQSASASPGIVTQDLTVKTPDDLVDTLLGESSGAVVTNITFNGSSIAAGIFNGGSGILGFDSGVILSSGKVADVVGPNKSDATSTTLGTPGDPDLQGLIPGYNTFDATVLEFDFECPAIDVVSFSYVFASEEYNEYVNNIFNNVFGFFLNGTNIALLPDGVTPVAINNVNGGNPLGLNASNPAYYINNDLSDGGGAIDIEADGLTVVLGAQASLSPGMNHIKLAIADAGDSVLDSWVFLEGGSFQCAPLTGIFPPSVTAELPRGGSIDEVKTVYVPPRPPKADVIFSFDLTGSMGSIISTAKTQAGNIITALDGLVGVDIEYGVMSYMDYPGTYNSCGYNSIYGDSVYGDYAYRLDQAITADPNLVTSAINALTLGSGADTPQDYTRIFYESYSDPNVSWRSGAKRIHLNFGDAIPHDCNINENVMAGVLSSGCDPGRDEIAGTADDLDLQTVLTEMAANGITLLEAHTTTNYNTYWAYWTGLTGGNVYLTASGTLVDDILAAVQAALEAPVVHSLHLAASAGYESWLVSVNPPSMDVEPGSTGTAAMFDITIQVPTGTPPGVYHFTISALDEAGVNYGDQDVTITVVNLPPVADLNGPYLGDEGSPIVFNGTESNDPDGDALTFDWDWGDGTSSLNAGATPTHTYDDNGNYTVCLTVTDLYGLSDTICSSTYGLEMSPGILWQDAKSAAEAMTYSGCSGHLVTITSQQEQDELYALFGSQLFGKWYGGYQEEGVIPANYGWQWVTGEPWVYTNWDSLEPNDAYGPASEQYLIGWLNQTSWDEYGKFWNDDGGNLDANGYVVEYDCAVTVNNVAPTATFNTPAYGITGVDFDLSLTDPYDPSSADTAAGFEYAFDCGDGIYSAWTNTNTASCHIDDIGSHTVKGKIRDKDGGETEYSALITILPPSAATDSALCYYDRAPEIEGQQFRLIFTPDMQLWPAYKLPASNPGQFFYNVFYTGEDPASFDISIPEPFVTQGANPVHVYTDVSVVEKDGFKCFEPDYESEIYAGDLENLPEDLPGGFLYVAIHLDYSLKGTTGYIPNANNDALSPDGLTVLIPNLDDYIFSVGGSQTDSQILQNVNEFKKIPGFGGLVMVGSEPLAGAPVKIYLNGNLLDTATTDEDGWYLYVYKHTGKPITYTVAWSGFSISGVLRANKFVEVNFP